MNSFERLKTLIALAKIDGEIAAKERQHIIAIGQANHLMITEILPLFAAAEETPAKFNLNEDEKIVFLLELVQLMRIDERIYKNEMQYCAHVAGQLGYREEVIFELMMRAKDFNPGDKVALRKAMQGYQK